MTDRRSGVTRGPVRPPSGSTAPDPGRDPASGGDFGSRPPFHPGPIRPSPRPSASSLRPGRDGADDPRSPVVHGPPPGGTWPGHRCRHGSRFRTPERAGLRRDGSPLPAGYAGPHSRSEPGSPPAVSVGGGRREDAGRLQPRISVQASTIDRGQHGQGIQGHGWNPAVRPGLGPDPAASGKSCAVRSHFTFEIFISKHIIFTHGCKS